MRLFKCYKKNIDYEDDIIVLWGKDENEAWDKVSQKYCKYDYYQSYLYEVYDEEVIDEIIERKELLKYLLRNQRDKFEVEMFKHTEKDLWIIEEIYVDKRSLVFACYPPEPLEQDDVVTVIVPPEVQDIEEFVYTYLAEDLMKDDLYLEYIMEYAINAGLRSEFFRINGQHAYDEIAWEFMPNENILNAFDANLSKANSYINYTVLKNIKSFFDEEVYLEKYLAYLRDHNEEHFNDESFVLYITKQIIKNRKYIDYKIVQV
ncbi:hypothetical protein [Metabacillus litoralis]|uniref:hypothetical protein n=1 Tax=Metabacillus litoralis TaxID=152268 RepID=UPI00203C4E53|nr:hypothetical protein [Metabacillus litoralis]MCM3161007.1 hypothetical protein [Metabacillus litoralis]